MKQDGKTPRQWRLEAEKKLNRAPLNLAQPSAGEDLLHELIHELSVHQIELEMQNEELRLTQAELKKSRDRYVDFYDFAPFAYLTLNLDGLIDEINHAGAALLGADRSKLLQHKFSAFVAPSSLGQWQQHLQSVLKSESKLTCELLLKNNSGASFPAQLDCLGLKNNGKEPVVRIALTDIGKYRQA